MNNCSKIYYIYILVILPFILAAILSGCSKAEKLELPINGEYEFGDVVFVSGLSSSTRDYLIKEKIGTKYIIKSDSLEILNDEHNIKHYNISYKEKNTDEGIEDFSIIEIKDNPFNEYKDKHVYYIYDDHGEVIPYYIFYVDGVVFIGKYETRGGFLVSSLDKLLRIK